MLFNLDFANNTVLWCFFFLIMDLYFLISAAAAQIFYPIAELIIPIGILSKETKAESEINPVTAEVKIRTHQFVLLYFFEEIISFFSYISLFKFLAYNFFNHIFKVVIYFYINQEISFSFRWFSIFALTANDRIN